MKGFELIYVHKCEPVTIENEKDCYKHFVKEMNVKGHKVFSPVLKGIPDYFVYEIDPPLSAGMYELKTWKGKVSPQQERFFDWYGKIFNCYLVVVNNRGDLAFYKRVPQKSVGGE